MNYLREFSRKHEQLKQRIHSFRIPLSPTGQRIMGFVYFCIPIIAGYYIMEYAKGRANENLKGLPAQPMTEEQRQLLDQQKQALTVLLNKHNPAKAEK